MASPRTVNDFADDRDLARRAHAGDVQAQRAIYDRASDRLFSLLCYQVGDRDEALDLLQDTFLRAFRKLDTYRGDAPLESWLRAIAMRRAMDWKRRTLQKLKKTTGLESVQDSVGPDLGEADPDHDALERGLAQLSPNQRAVLLLHDWEGQSFEEISAVLGCKPSTVRVHHARARERMRTLLESEETAS